MKLSISKGKINTQQYQLSNKHFLSGSDFPLTDIRGMLILVTLLKTTFLPNKTVLRFQRTTHRYPVKLIWFYLSIACEEISLQSERLFKDLRHESLKPVNNFLFLHSFHIRSYEDT